MSWSCCRNINSWVIRCFSSSIRNDYSGVCITIDYGYKEPPNNFSLQTIYNHKKTHLFENLGNQDITAHVNFDELMNIACKYELKIDLFCNQKDFLNGCGLKERKGELQKNKSV